MATTSSVQLVLGTFGLEDTATYMSPDFTFWTGTRPHHTHFVVDYAVVEPPGGAQWGMEVPFKVEKHFDLWRAAWLVVDLPALNGGAGGARYCDDVGRAMWDSVRLTTANLTINTLYPEMDHALEELHVDPANQTGQLTGRCDTVAELIDRARAPQRLYVKLNFYFTYEDQDAFPLINVVGSDIYVRVKLKTAANCIVSSTGSAYVPTLADQTLTRMQLLMEVIHLTDAERKIFIDENFAYFYVNNDIQQPTQIAAGSTTFQLKMDFNHPIKDVLLMLRKASRGAVTSNVAPAHNYFDWSGDEATAPFQGEAFSTLQMKLNGGEFWRPMDPHFFRKVLALSRYGRIPRKHVYPFPLSLYPGQVTATGSMNLSKIDGRVFNFTFGTATTEVMDVLCFTRHWNEIKFIESGIQVMYA
jgi:hypothetical protein